ncbi:MAG: ABC transporter permease [Mogibacterium sp.]|nr:ABC transporter permease [Mogibacterium sp.]
MLKRSTLREIRASKERYLAIMAIVALGVGFFSGLKVTKAGMLSTCEDYLAKCNFFDYQIATSYGIDEDSVKLAEKNANVKTAEATRDVDAIISFGDEQIVMKAISMPEKINIPQIKSGRMPKATDECVVDNLAGFKIGDKVIISTENDEDTIKSFKIKEFKVVGLVSSPLYLDYQRRVSSVGNGNVTGFFYIPDESFDMDYYTGLYLIHAKDRTYFGDGATDFLEDNQKPIESLADDINAARRDVAIKTANEKLQEKVDEYEDGLAEYNSQKSSADKKIADAKAELDSNANALATKKTELNNTLTTLNQQKTAVENGLAQVQAGIAQLEALGTLTPAQQQMLADLKAQEAQLTTQLAQINGGITACNQGLVQIAEGEKKISDGRAELNKQKATADSEFASAKKKLDDAKEQLDKAKIEIEDMEAGKSYVFTRNDNIGYSVYDENASIVDGIAKIFPVFFFLVAALVCMTTMTRMIDEHRTQIGVLKALGYSNGSILGKYMFYSGSAAIIGAVVGFFAGCKIFPVVIWNAYQMMYDFEPKINFIFNPTLGLIVLLVAMLCSMGATWVSCMSDFRVQPAELIRPKSPPAGKRILLERIEPLWKKIGFLYKVSIRNTFRYKKRFFMMVLGISGCTALLIAGFGINTTIKNVAKFQFEEVIKYDYMIVFNDDMTAEKQTEFNNYCKDDVKEDVGDVIYLNMVGVDVKTAKDTVQVSLVVSDGKDFDKYVDLHDGNTKLEYPGEGEAIVCKEMQTRRGVNEGDTITIKDGYRTCDVKVVGVCDNYVRNYVYITKETFEKGFGKASPVKTAFVNSPDGATPEQIRGAAEDIKESELVAAAAVNLDTVDMVEKMMQSLDAIVFVVILCAGLLAFIVLYNLTNINITERIREIATIKVLGFYDWETGRYVFRENYFLTAIAAVVGIPLGTWLLRFVVSKICVNTIFFVPRITLLDYVLSVIMTFVFAVVVSLAMKRRLRNVSMTESLKSIE